MKIELPPELTGANGFKNFLYLAWRAVLGVDPTPMQYDIGDYLQNGPKKLVIMAPRGIGKSWIASAYVVWELLLDPKIQVLVVSASHERAKDFTQFCLQLMSSMGDLTAHMLPRGEQRSSKTSFDVSGAGAAHQASVSCKGINAMLAGSRADIIIGDDVSTPDNSFTQVMRDKISRATREFVPILKPGGQTIFLGTPHTEQDLLHELPTRGFEPRIWTAEVPDEKLADTHGNRLAPMIREKIKEGLPPGWPMDPRFPEEVLMEKRALGMSYYRMQFMMDQTLSDMERYPLKINDLIVTDLDSETCAERYVYGKSPDLRWNDLECVGFNGDYYHHPMDVSKERRKYNGIVMAIDPSGSGTDETSYAVVGQYGSQLFVLDCFGLQGGYSPEVLEKLTTVAEHFKVNRIIVESNMGDGMFSSLLTPYLAKRYPCTIEEIRHLVQKERRICDVLEGVIQSHKLIVDRKVVANDLRQAHPLLGVQHRYPQEQGLHYRLFHQLSRITRDKGALRRDDRLDALAMAVQFWKDALAQDLDKKIERDHAMDRKKKVKDFLDRCKGVKSHRYAGVARPRSRATWTSARPVG